MFDWRGVIALLLVLTSWAWAPAVLAGTGTAWYRLRAGNGGWRATAWGLLAAALALVVAFAAKKACDMSSGADTMPENDPLTVVCTDIAWPAVVGCMALASACAVSMPLGGAVAALTDFRFVDAWAWTFAAAALGIALWWLIPRPRKHTPAP